MIAAGFEPWPHDKDKFDCTSNSFNIDMITWRIPQYKSIVTVRTVLSHPLILNHDICIVADDERLNMANL